MDNLTFWIVVFFGAITVYRLLSRRAATPQARVAAMLRRCHRLQKAGLSERECLLRLLATRRHWKRLPHRFLEEVVSRFHSKEDVMRFVSVSEDYRYYIDHYPAIAAKTDLETAMAETACLFSRFGFTLQAEGRYKEAEFVQKLALQLQPARYFTTLPLAATYHETGRHADALPLFERGLREFEENIEPPGALFSPAKCLGSDVESGKLRNRYKKMYQACIKAAENKTLPGFYLLGFLELV
jgi:tetratricopeptide (TPR) repeat protein